MARLNVFAFCTMLSFLPAVHAAVPADCPKTTSANSRFGGPKLSVQLPPSGTWRGMGPDQNYRDKLFWFRDGIVWGDERNLVVSGKLLDGSNLQAIVSKASGAEAPSLGGKALLVLVEFPRAGCWEITGRYLDQTLKFVVEVPPNNSVDR